MKSRTKQIQDQANQKTLLFADAYKMIVQGDHWLDGRGLPVSKPKQNEQSFKVVDPELKRLFNWQNILLEVVKRSRDAVSAVNWRFVPNRELGFDKVTEEVNGVQVEVSKQRKPTPEEQALMLEVDSALTVWWDEQDVWSKIQTAIMYGLFSRESIDALNCAVVLRLFVPKSENTVNADGQEVLEADDLLSALRKIHLEIPHPLHSGFIRDVDHVVIGGYVDSGTDDQKMFEEVKIEDGKTIISVSRQGQEPEQASYDIGGNLTLIELVFEVLIYPDMIENQKHFNKSWTALSANLDGVLNIERVLINANIDPKQAIEVGAGSIQSYVGIPLYSGKEITGYTNPNFQRLDPIDPSAILATAQAFKSAIIDAARQKHTEIIGDASVSNVSRIGSTNDHKASVFNIKNGVQKAVRSLLSTALRWAAHIENPSNDTRFDGLRPDVMVKITATQPTPEDDANTRANYETGLLDQEESMVRIGVDDPGAMLSRINEARQKALAFAADPKGANNG